ncbi:MAG: type II toxin-antitoxin system VapC family toxin [Candidatus Diapherotrites archaeon]|nr:type II toxin-antitoxin system VapC family toxin [Candidatus Diapherotrites archaeon]
MIVVDSTLIIDYLNGKDDAKNLYEKISKADLIFTTIFNYQETTFLPIHKDSDKSLAEVNSFFEKIKLLYPTKNSVLITNRISSFLKKKGMTVEIVDCLIAGIVIENNAKLLTLNKKHFQHMPNLVMYEEK